MAINANYMTLNPLYLINNSYPPSTSYVIDGNLTVLNAPSNFGIGMTHGFYSGKWYWEVLVSDVGQHLLGFLTLDDFTNQKSQPHNAFGSYLVYTSTSGQGIRYVEKSFNNITFSVSDGDIVQFALDRDNRKCWVGLNGTYIESGNPAGNSNPLFDSSDISATTGVFMPVFGTYGAQNNKQTLNAGQDSSFAGQKTSGSANATDGNGFGDFYYTPPTGFLSACSNNVPTSDDIDPAQTDDDFPQKQCGVLKNNSTGGDSYTGLGFRPDLVWVKWTEGDQGHGWFDSSRGTSKVLNSDSTAAEATSSGLTSFDSDGYTMGTYYNQSGREYMGWCWRANGGTTSSNTDGDITSTVQANQEAGFSIVTYSGTLSSVGTASVGHGLTKKPEFLLSKARTTNNDNGNWHCSHVGLTSYNYRIRINTNEGEANRSSAGDMASLFTNSTFGTNYTSGLNTSGDTFVAYVWHSVDGYSKFGKYTANGNANGPFIYTGFRPKIIIIKGLVTGSGWVIKDDTLDGSNPGTGVLEPNQGSGKYTTAGGVCDILSNGFKVRTANAVANSTSYDPYVYMAWGSVPFKYNNTF